MPHRFSILLNRTSPSHVLLINSLDSYRVNSFRCSFPSAIFFTHERLGFSFNALCPVARSRLLCSPWWFSFSCWSSVPCHPFFAARPAKRRIIVWPWAWSFCFRWNNAVFQCLVSSRSCVWPQLARYYLRTWFFPAACAFLYLALYTFSSSLRLFASSTVRPHGTSWNIRRTCSFAFFFERGTNLLIEETCYKKESRDL